MKTSKNKNRKYFKPGLGTADESQASNKFKIFLLRYHDDETNSVLNEGPYSNEEEAMYVLNNYLKQGICSWVVTYNE
tara:strand:+ start:441 stop:671 length:231 start_codon:yes stop_codon:yes gene_type:complete